MSLHLYLHTSWLLLVSCVVAASGLQALPPDVEDLIQADKYAEALARVEVLLKEKPGDNELQQTHADLLTEVKRRPSSAPAATGTAGDSSLPGPSNPFVNSLGMKFVQVPGTQVLFSIWDTRVRDYAAYADSRGRAVDPSWRNPGFKQTDDHPVVKVSWNDAQTFCLWLSKKDGQTYRLPTDEEWSMAAGLGKEEGKTIAERSSWSAKRGDQGLVKSYPWGAFSIWPPPKNAGNYGEEIPGRESDGFKNTAPVGSFPANELGLYDMGGNVWQLCHDFCDPPSSPDASAVRSGTTLAGDESGLLGKGWKTEPARSAPQQDRPPLGHILRGGGWRDQGRALPLLSFRSDRKPDYREATTGFRCVLVLSANQPAPLAAGQPQGAENLSAGVAAARTGQSAELSALDQRELDLIIADLKIATGDARQKPLKELVDRTAELIQTHPDSLQLWAIRATTTLELEQAGATKEAGANLLRLGADVSSNDQMLSLLAMLKRKGWLMNQDDYEKDKVVMAKQAREQKEKEATDAAAKKKARAAKIAELRKQYKNCMAQVDYWDDVTSKDRHLRNPTYENYSVDKSYEWGVKAAQILGELGKLGVRGKELQEFIK